MFKTDAEAVNFIRETTEQALSEIPRPGYFSRGVQSKDLANVGIASLGISADGTVTATLAKPVSWVAIDWTLD